MSEKDFLDGDKIISKEQLRVVNTFADKLPDEKWIVIKSRPGCGKSFLLRYLKEYLQNQFHQENTILTFAPTNLAASNINGLTIHKFLGYGQEMIRVLNKLQSNVKYEDIWFLDESDKIVENIILREIEENILSTTNFLKNNEFCYDDKNKSVIIIIDETSMVPVHVFYALCVYLRKYENKWFVLFGDEKQLQPISTIQRNLYDVIRSKNEKDVLIFNLEENQRIENNEHFDQFIKDWWLLKNISIDIENFNWKCNLNFGGNVNAFEQLSYPKLSLCGTRKAVENINEKELAKLEGNMVTFNATIVNFNQAKYTNYELFQLSVLTDKFKIKNKCQIICLKSIGNEIYTNEIYTVLGWKQDNDLLKCEVFITSVNHDHNNCTDCKSFDATLSQYLEIKQKHIIRITPYEDNLFEYKPDGSDNLIGKITQFPFQPYFAATIHRMQGCTITIPTLIRFNSFWKNSFMTLAYVAMSRLTRPELLYYDKHPFAFFPRFTKYINNSKKRKK